MQRRFILFSLLLFVFCVNGFAAENDAKENVTYKTETDISYYPQDVSGSNEYINERCKLDLYYPQNKPGFPTIVWFHGGGLKAGNRYIPAELMEKGVAVAAVNYRFYPKVKCPGYLKDAAAAVAWVFQNIENYGGNANLIIVSGHSAGGYLTSMIGLDKKWLAPYGIDADQIAALVPFSGHTITHMTVREERGIPDVQPIVDEMAPLYHVRTDAPPFVFITGDRNLEMLGRYEENAYMWRMMQVAGHKQSSLYEIQGFDHGGMAVPAFSILLDYIEKLTADN